ncbi:MAG: hypothetical protein ACE5DM_01865 [Candidatus Nanoarchaeia archaeon]
MGKKKKKEPKPSQRNTQAVDERLKQINSLTPPDENPWKMENERKIDRWRPANKSSRLSIADEKRLNKRKNRRLKAKVMGPKRY